VAIAPPVMYLGTAEAALSGCGCSCGGKSVIQLGAQNVDINVKGAFTGDISSEMLKDFGAKYIIIGHSERRTYHKESDEFVAKKFGALKEAGLVPVLCIGETEAENEAGKTEEVCARQIDAVINALGVEAFNGAVINQFGRSARANQQLLHKHKLFMHLSVATSQQNHKQ